MKRLDDAALHPKFRKARTFNACDPGPAAQRTPRSGFDAAKVDAAFFPAGEPAAAVAAPDVDDASRRV